MKIINYEDILLDKNITLIKDVIDTGGIVIYPTDTLYGIGGNFFSLKVSQQIDKIKGRSTAPYSVAVADIEMLKRLVTHIPDLFHECYEKQLPGKYTFLFHANPSLDKDLIKGSGKIGIRIPDAPKLLKLIKALDTPFITTSVNRTGSPPLNDPATILDTFIDTPGISLLLDAGPLPPSNGSTIIDVTESPARVVRVGDTPVDFTGGLF